MQFFDHGGHGECTLTMAEAESGCVDTVIYHTTDVCDECAGTGKRGLFKCRKCRGVRRLPCQVPLRVSVKPGAQSGDHLEYFILEESHKQYLPAGYALRVASPGSVAQPVDIDDVSGGVMGDILMDLFGAAPAAKPRPAAGKKPQSPDIAQTLTVTAREAANGCTKSLCCPIPTPCSFCGGSGEAVKGSSPVCPKCSGEGTMKTQNRTPLGTVVTARACNRCSGKGILLEAPCTACGGSGTAETQECVSVPIPSGSQDGYTVIMPGKGAHMQSGARGKLTVTVKVRME